MTGTSLRRVGAGLLCAAVFVSSFLVPAGSGGDSAPAPAAFPPSPGPEVFLVKSATGSTVVVGPTVVTFGGTRWRPQAARWEAIRDSVWTFDSGVGSHFQHSDTCKAPALHARMEGWTGRNLTASVPEARFRRLHVSDFEGAPRVCVGDELVVLSGEYSIWAGLLPAEAESSGYERTGYGNRWAVRAERVYEYRGSACMTFAFSYRVVLESDPFFFPFFFPADFLSVRIDTSEVLDGSGDVELVRLLGADDGRFIEDLYPGEHLPSSPRPVRISFTFRSDDARSSEDGKASSATCNGVGLDDILWTDTTCNGSFRDLSDFETGLDGWTLRRLDCGEGEARAGLFLPATVPGLEVAVACGFGDSALSFYDPADPCGLREEIALSPWLDLTAASAPDPGDLSLVFEYFVREPEQFRGLGLLYLQYFPGCPEDTCRSPSGLEPVDTAIRLDPGCGVYSVALGDRIPGHAEAVRVGLGATNFCWSPSAGGCPGPVLQTPIYDNVRFEAPISDPTIQDVLDLAASGDTVVVPPGTYRGPGNRDLDPKGKNLVILASAGPENTILDCEGGGRGFVFRSGEDARSVVEGFTVLNGDAGAGDAGGGILVRDAAAEIRNCRLVACAAGTAGGGVSMDGGRIADTQIVECSAPLGGGAWVAAGEIEDCLLLENRADRGGGIAVDGAARIVGCRVEGNEAELGGGLSLEAKRSEGDPASGIEVTQSLITENSATRGGGAVHAGDAEAPALYVNATFRGNVAGDGSALAIEGGAVALERTILWGNPVRDPGGAGLAVLDGSVSLDCCAVETGTVRGNAGQLGPQVTRDPLFCGEGGSGLHEGSPCLPDRSPCGELIGASSAVCPPLPGSPVAGALALNPNPAHGPLEILWTLAVESAPVSIAVFDVRGRQVREFPGLPASGRTTWDATSGTGIRVSSGIYFVRLSGGGASHVRRLVLVQGD